MVEKFGEQVARLRGERKWSQQKLSDVSGVPVRTLQSVENNPDTRPQRKTRLALSKALGIEGDPQQERADWPRHVQVFLDTMGVYLMSLEEDERLSAIHDFTSDIFARR